MQNISTGQSFFIAKDFFILYYISVKKSKLGKCTTKFYNTYMWYVWNTKLYVHLNVIFCQLGKC